MTKKIVRPTCKTCIYLDRGNKQVCRHTSNVLKDRGSTEWCGDHPDFADYIHAIKNSRPKCITCIFFSPREKDEDAGEEYRGTCRLKQEDIWPSCDSCYLHEEKISDKKDCKTDL